MSEKSVCERNRIKCQTNDGGVLNFNPSEVYVCAYLFVKLKKMFSIPHE